MLGLAALLGCKQSTTNQSDGRLTYTTDSDSALYYFYRGWEQIMDEGDWTGSEESYRKSMMLDNDFLVVKTLVGRITSDSSERIAIQQEVEKKKNVLDGLELDLVEAYNTSLAYIIQRDRGAGVDKEVVQRWMNLSESTLGAIAHKYPNEPYSKAEYIEFLHSVHGPEVALDSLNVLTTESQKRLGFFISYAALLHSEMGEFEAALQKMEEYLSLYSNPTFSSSHAYYAQIYFDMDSLSLASTSVDKALELESNHIIAQRLKAKIEKALTP